MIIYKSFSDPKNVLHQRVTIKKIICHQWKQLPLATIFFTIKTTHDKYEPTEDDDDDGIHG
jgi:hypothetical protein